MAKRLDPEVRREQILDTVLTLIAEEGYRGLTLRGVARACGMSAPGLMHHFHDLPTLLMAVLDRRDQVDWGAVVESTGQQGTAAQTARALLDGVVHRMAANPEGARLFAVLEAEALVPSHPAHAYFKERTARVAEGFEVYLAAVFDDPVEASRRVMAIWDGLQLSWLREPDSFDLVAQWRAIADRLIPGTTPSGPVAAPDQT